MKTTIATLFLVLCVTVLNAQVFENRAYIGRVGNQSEIWEDLDIPVVLDYDAKTLTIGSTTFKLTKLIHTVEEMGTPEGPADLIVWDTDSEYIIQLLDYTPHDPNSDLMIFQQLSKETNACYLIWTEVISWKPRYLNK